MEVPIACALDDADARTRLDEWRRVLAATVGSAERTSPRELCLHLFEGGPQVDVLVELARLEATCCPFFTFSLLIEADGLVLRVGVSDGDAAALDALVGGWWPA